MSYKKRVVYLNSFRLGGGKDGVVQKVLSIFVVVYWGLKTWEL